MRDRIRSGATRLRPAVGNEDHFGDPRGEEAGHMPFTGSPGTLTVPVLAFVLAPPSGVGPCEDSAVVDAAGGVAAAGVDPLSRGLSFAAAQRPGMPRSKNPQLPP